MHPTYLSSFCGCSSGSVSWSFSTLPSSQGGLVAASDTFPGELIFKGPSLPPSTVQLVLPPGMPMSESK